MSGSIVLDLQRDALDSKVEVSALLRKALVVGRKLGLSQFVEWCNRELDGYPDDVEFPEYRFIDGEVKAFNPVRGWIPVAFEDPKIARAASRRPITQAVPEIESQVENAGYMPFSAEMERKLQEAMGASFKVGTHFSARATGRVLNGVRNAILNWTLKLEEDGVLGEGLSFTANEKTVAAQPQHAITQFLGPVTGVQIQQFSGGSRQNQSFSSTDIDALIALVSKLRKELPGFALEHAAEVEAKSELTTIEAQAQSPQPKRTIIKESLASLRKILESVTGSVSGALLLEQIRHILQTLSL